MGRSKEKPTDPNNSNRLTEKDKADLFFLRLKQEIPHKKVIDFLFQALSDQIKLFPSQSDFSNGSFDNPPTPSLPINKSSSSSSSSHVYNNDESLLRKINFNKSESGELSNDFLEKSEHSLFLFLKRLLQDKKIINILRTHFSFLCYLNRVKAITTYHMTKEGFATSEDIAGHFLKDLYNAGFLERQSFRPYHRMRGRPVYLYYIRGAPPEAQQRIKSEYRKAKVSEKEKKTKLLSLETELWWCPDCERIQFPDPVTGIMPRDTCKQCRRKLVRR